MFQLFSKSLGFELQERSGLYFFLLDFFGFVWFFVGLGFFCGWWWVFFFCDDGVLILKVGIELTAVSKSLINIL